MSEEHKTEQTGTAVVVPPPKKVALAADHDGIMPIVPRDLDQAWRYAEMVCRAGLAPSSYDDNPQKVVIGVLSALELGVPPMQGLKGIAIINNRPCVWGDLAIALIQSKGVVDHAEQSFTGEPDKDDYTAHYVIWRKGQATPYEGHFSVKEAKRAGLWGNVKKRPWIDYPTRMLLMRARAYALRDGFSDCLMGLPLAEEVQDISEAPKAVSTDFLGDEVAPKQIEAAPAPEATEAPKVAAE